MSNLGYSLEIQVTEFFRELFKKALIDPKNKIFRVIGSGRSKNATLTGGETTLEGDVSVEVSSLPKNILIECKHYKSRTKERSFAVKKEWLDQALHEAAKINRWSMVAIKFKGVAPNSVELKKYVWADGKFGNNIHYIIPEIHLAEMLQCIESVKSEVLNNKEDMFSQVSDEDLVQEVKNRLQRREEKCLDGLDPLKQNILPENTENTENS
jgi:protein subunit release factor A